MKTSQKQKEAITICKKLLSYWETSNDIDSPTLEGDIDEEFFLSSISDQDIDELEYSMRLLLNTIRNIK